MQLDVENERTVSHSALETSESQDCLESSADVGSNYII